MNKKHAVLINNAHVENFSVRALSAYLKDKGFKVSTIHYEGRKEGVFTPLSDQSLAVLAEYCRDCDLVGISLLTDHLFTRSIQISGYLRKRIQAPIIWGGPPVMGDPGYFLTHADLVCAGEGEHVMEQLLAGVPKQQIPGLGFLDADGNPVVNDPGHMLDPNTLPIPRVDLDDGYILSGPDLTPLKTRIHKSLSTYSVLLVKGCPYQCAYCLNSRLMTVFRKKGKYVRKIDVDRVIAELEWAKSRIPLLKRVIIDDDDFFLNSEERMDRFLGQYMETIGLPVFYLQANARQITRKKLEILASSGLQLRYLKMGLQSGSSRVSRDVFNRPLDKATYLKKLEMVISAGFRVMIDVISANPYETADDKYDVLCFYLDMLGIVMGRSTVDIPIKMYDHKLMYYPGTALYERAMADRHIPRDYVNQVLLKRSTLRLHPEDLDHDALFVWLFNVSVRKKFMSGLTWGLLRIMKIRPLFHAMVRFNLAGRLAVFSRIPGVAAFFKNMAA